MFLRIARFAVVTVCFVLAAASRGDTVAFPKENPAFTAELPQGAEAKWKSDALTVPLLRFGMVSFDVLPDSVHDDASARAWLGNMLSRYMGNFYVALEKPPAPDVPEHRESISQKAEGFLVQGFGGGTVGEAGTRVGYKNYLAAVFTIDNRKYFFLWSEFDTAVDHLLKQPKEMEFVAARDRIIKSIKPVK